MKSISYILKENEDRTIAATVSISGPLTYTGRILLENYSDNGKLTELIERGPLGRVGYFEDECEGMIHPSVIEAVKAEEFHRIPPAFKKGPKVFNNLKEISKLINSHTHYSKINIFFRKQSGQWYFSKFKAENFLPLNFTTLYIDDEENG